MMKNLAFTPSPSKDLTTSIKKWWFLIGANLPIIPIATSVSLSLYLVRNSNRLLSTFSWNRLKSKPKGIISNLDFGAILCSSLNSLFCSELIAIILLDFLAKYLSIDLNY